MEPKRKPSITNILGKANKGGDRLMALNRKKAIVLGGTSPHIALIERLQKRGYYVYLLDYLDNPPAKNYADEHIVESTLDQDAVLRVAREVRADLVISACVDQANITACYVMEQIGHKPPYSYETAKRITNKGVMKEVMKANGIPTSDYIYIEKEMDCDTLDVKFPVMVKPADCNSASGVKKARNRDELKKYMAEALDYSRNHRAVVEGYVTGVEISAYCFVQNKKAKVIMASERMSITEGEDQVLKCYATLSPARLSTVAYAEIEAAATKIAESFELDNTPLHVQAFVHGDDISIIEFAPRVGGGISYQTIFDNTGFDILESTIDSFLGNPVDVKFSSPSYISTVNLIYGKPAVFDHVEGQEKLLKDGIIRGLYYHKTKGMKLGTSRASEGRVGAYIIEAASMDELVQKTKKANETLEVYADDGTAIMRKDLCILRDL